MKAAIQMSLGLIVTVVFAIVLLSLAITWIQGMLSDITGITDDLTGQASAKLTDIFAETDSNFAVWPPEWEVTRGNGIKTLAGIRNNAADSQEHYYVMNVIPSGASESVCDTRDVRTCDSGVAGHSTLYDYMLTWVTTDPLKFRVNTLDSIEKVVVIEVPKDARKGYYLFNVVACYDEGSGTDLGTASNCLADSSNLWSSAESITIKAE